MGRTNGSLKLISMPFFFKQPHPLSFIVLLLSECWRMYCMDDYCMQLLIIKDGERNHSMGSLMDGTPSQSETDSDRLMKDNAVIINHPIHSSTLLVYSRHFDNSNNVVGVGRTWERWTNASSALCNLTWYWHRVQSYDIWQICHRQVGIGSVQTDRQT